NPITKIAKDAGAETYFTDDGSLAVYDVDGSRYKDKTVWQTESKYNRALTKLRGSKSKSFADAFFEAYPQHANDRLWTFMLSAYLEFDTGGDLARLSSLDFYDDEEFGGDDIIITNGFDKVAEYLGEGIDVRLNTRVSSIDYSGEQIVVESNADKFSADLVLLTVPLGVLKKNVISFTPGLPETTRASIDGIQMGSVNKFLCVWEKPFWSEDIQYIGVTPASRGKFNYFMNADRFTDAPALMTFAFGDYSIKTEQMSDAEVIAAIMAHLRAVCGEDTPDPVQLLRTKWVSDENAYGAYSYASNGVRSDAFEVFETPVGSRLFFAGEHTSKDYRGTVHGAYLSGIREAKRIASIL
ncbi:MAG: FAD-dependent oxidoreductase, partial [Pseudomonadota bacterium]